MAIVLGLPKGSLQESTFALFKRAGFAVSCSSRSYYPSIDDEEIKCRLLRPQEMSRYVELGLLDAGICGYDWVYENGSDVVDICELSYSKATSNPVRWVLAVPNDSKIKTVKDLKGKRISTEALGIVNRYLKANGVKANVEFSWGATEVKAPELVDAIVDLTETGSSLRANNLRIVDTILTSTTRLIANKKAWKDKAKRAKIEQLKMLLTAALAIGAGNAFSRDFVTDENGQIHIEGLRVGNYVISEVGNKANEKYVLPENVTVTVHEGKTVVAKFYNELKPVIPDVPKTGDTTNMPLWAALAGISLLGAGAVAFFTFRKKKEVGKHER